MHATINGARPLTGADLAEIFDSDLPADLCLIGIINYRDRNGTLRSTSFFRIFSERGRRFSPAPSGDEFSDLEYED